MHTLNAWGDIYIDGELKGRTGRLKQPIDVRPGTHTLVIRNTYALPYQESFTVVPGEDVDITTPALQRKPVTVDIDPGVDDACTVRLDQVDMGTVGALGHSLELAAPDQRHRVELACPDRTTQHQVGPLRAGETATIP